MYSLKNLGASLQINIELAKENIYQADAFKFYFRRYCPE